MNDAGIHNMSDLISRQAAIDAVHEEFDECLVWDESGEYTADAVERILDRLPSAQPERKTGKWIKHSIGHEHTPWGFDCSECGEWFVVGEEVIKKYNYCPNCGSYNGEQPC